MLKLASKIQLFWYWHTAWHYLYESSCCSKAYPPGTVHTELFHSELDHANILQKQANKLLNCADSKAFLTIAGVFPHSSSEMNEALKTDGLLKWQSSVRWVCVPSLRGSGCVSCLCQGTFYIDHLRTQKAMVECWGGVSFSFEDGWLTEVLWPEWPPPRPHLHPPLSPNP